MLFNCTSSEELGANVFRITQTEALLRKQQEQSEIKATNTHYKVGKEIRKTIKRLDGTMPEDLPTPEKSIKQLKKEGKDKLLEDKLNHKNKQEQLPI